jgi:hypothetical protein
MPHSSSRGHAVQLAFLAAFTVIGAVSLLWGKWPIALVSALFAIGYLRHLTRRRTV